MPTEDVTPEAEARWQAWLDKGRARDMRTRRKAKAWLLVLLFGGAALGALAFGLR